MSRLRQQSSFKSMEEEEDGITSSSKAALVSLLNKEVGSVLAVMNARWGGDQLDHSLILSLKELRKQIFCQRDIDPVFYLLPFLDVIQSEKTDAAITNAALSSVYKVLRSDFLSLSTVSCIEEAMNLVVESVTSCSFEITEPAASEEAVLMKVLQVLVACVKGKTSAVLSDQNVCIIFNSCFRLLHQAGATKGEQKKVAGYTMQELVRCIFSHLPDVENTKYGVPCMFEILHFLFSLLNDVEDADSKAFDEYLPGFALDLINSAIEFGGPAIQHHPSLLNMVQDELFCNLIRFGLSKSPQIISAVCSIVVNLYLHLRAELKLQMEAFVSCVLLRLANSCCGASYQQQEAGMQALVDLCRHGTFMAEMYANLDCDITCSNVFEEVVNVLSKSAFPADSPLSAMHILALDGLIALVQGMAEKESLRSESCPVVLDKYTPFWMLNRDNFKDPDQWLSFVRTRKYMKKRLRIAANHFNRDPKKGLEFLQGDHLLPEKLDPESVACFFRYAAGLDKNLVGDFLGNHEDFCVRVLHEFAKTFDFQDMNVDTALRLFLETFRLPGESQKIQRVLEAFSERYYEQFPLIIASKDAALLLSYSIIMLNTDQHNTQVKNKMSEDDFVRNNREINDGDDFPREFLSEIYHSICKNEIRTTPVEERTEFAEMTPSKWIDLMNKSKKTAKYIVPDPRAFLDRDMFSTMSGPTISAISAVYSLAEDEEVCQKCIDGFLAVAKVSASHHLEGVLDDVVVSVSNFTTLLNEDPVRAFVDNAKAQTAALALFTIANKYSDFIRAGWRNIVECILRLHQLKLLPPATLETIQKCKTYTIFAESKFLGAESFLHLARALTWAAGRPRKRPCSVSEDEDTAVSCLELLISITLNNLERIGILWGGVYAHLADVVESYATPCVLVEKAVFGLLRICQMILPHEEDKAEELLKLLQKLDSGVSEAYCEEILEEVIRMVEDLKRTRITSESDHSQDRLLSHLYAILDGNTYSLSSI